MAGGKGLRGAVGQRGGWQKVRQAWLSMDVRINGQVRQKVQGNERSGDGCQASTTRCWCSTEHTGAPQLGDATGCWP